MTLSDLKTLIEEIEAEVGGEDVEVVLGVNPEWAFLHRLGGVSVVEEDGEKKVVLCDGGQMGYAPEGTFDNQMRL